MTQQGLEGQIEAARILRQLAVISKEVDLPETQVVCRIIVGPRITCNYMYLMDPQRRLTWPLNLFSNTRQETVLKSSGNSSRQTCCHHLTKHTDKQIPKSWQ